MSSGFLCYIIFSLFHHGSLPPRFHLSLSDCVYLGSDRTDGHVWSVQIIPGTLVRGPLNCITRNSNKGMYSKSNERYEYQNGLHLTHPPIRKFSCPISWVCWKEIVLTRCKNAVDMELHLLVIYGMLSICAEMIISLCNTVNVPIKRRWRHTLAFHKHPGHQDFSKNEEIYQDCRCKMAEIIWFCCWIFFLKSLYYDCTTVIW